VIEALSLLLGACVGLVLGLTGAGGSILAVPLLMGALGWPLLAAAPVGLAAVAASAALGTALAWPRGLVRWRAALLMAVFGWALAPLGAKAATVLPVAALLLAFAAIVALAAARLWRQAATDPAEDAQIKAATLAPAEARAEPVCPTNPATGRIRWNQRCAWVLASVGAGSGLMSGLVGVGGGFVIVPALRAVSPLTVHSAAATSLMAVALISSGALAALALRGVVPPPGVALPFVAGALVGMVGGRTLSLHLAAAPLQRLFAGLMALVALWMLWRAIQAAMTG
jgi:uncharacterized membrane protein YfcA